MNTSNKTIFNTLDDERSEKADQMHQIFLELSVDFTSGVPCGVLRHIIKNFNDDSKIFHVPANRESEAVGLYKIPIFFVVSYRGCAGEDAIQHLTTGRVTETLLQSFGLPFVVFGKHDLDVLIRSMFEKMRKINLSTFLLLKRGWQR